MLTRRSVVRSLALATAVALPAASALADTPRATPRPRGADPVPVVAVRAGRSSVEGRAPSAAPLPRRTIAKNGEASEPRRVDAAARPDWGRRGLAGEAASAIALGAYVAGAPNEPAQIDAFVELVGRMPAVVMWYEQWRGWDNGAFRPAQLHEVKRRGAKPMITWDPWNPWAGLDQPEFRLARIASGRHDKYVDSWARGLKTYGKPVFLRFGHEMNGNWYPWGAGVNGNRPADYVAAWRHLHRRFAKIGARNVRWVWSPTVAYEGSTPLAELYPGDGYVDWVALDGYNWGTSLPGKRWESFTEIFLPSYRELLELTEKPIMIAETASTELGGDKAQWVRNAFLNELPTTFPRVRAVVWFQEDKETDWRVSSSEAALAAFRTVARKPSLQRWR